MSQDVAGWEGHFRQSGGVPSCHQDASAVRIVFQLVYDGLQLVDPLTLIIVMHGLVSRPEMPPLEPIYGAKVPFLPLGQADTVEELARGVPIPNPDLLVVQQLGISVSIDEPDELLGHAPPENVLGGQHGEALAQIEPHLIAEV